MLTDEGYCTGSLDGLEFSFPLSVPIETLSIVNYCKEGIFF